MTQAKHEHRGRSSESLIEKVVVLDALDIKRGNTILDAGCGNGYMTKEFSKRVGAQGKIYALDPDPVVINALIAETAGGNIEPFVGDITAETKISESSFDLIYLSMVVHGFSHGERTGFVREIKRLLKTDGRLAVLEVKKKETSFGPPLNIRLSPEELSRMLGLREKKIADIGEYFYLKIFEK